MWALKPRGVAALQLVVELLHRPQPTQTFRPFRLFCGKKPIGTGSASTSLRLHQQAAFGGEPAGLAIEQAGVVPISTGFKDGEFGSSVEWRGECVVVDVAITLAGYDFARHHDSVGILVTSSLARHERETKYEG